MLRFMVLAIALIAVSAEGEDRKKCFRLMHPESMRCCKNELPPPNMKKEDLSECFKIPHEHHSCEHDICVGKKRGYASDDGSVDMEAFEKMVNEDFKSVPTLVEAIKENCIKSDVSKYGPPDACQLEKLKFCIHKSMVQDCKEWDDNGPCAGLKDLVRECANLDK